MKLIVEHPYLEVDKISSEDKITRVQTSECYLVLKNNKI